MATHPRREVCRMTTLQNPARNARRYPENSQPIRTRMVMQSCVMMPPCAFLGWIGEHDIICGDFEPAISGVRALHHQGLLLSGIGLRFSSFGRWKVARQSVLPSFGCHPIGEQGAVCVHGMIMYDNVAHCKRIIRTDFALFFAKRGMDPVTASPLRQVFLLWVKNRTLYEILVTRTK